MTANDKAKELVNACWVYADKPTVFIGRANARELAKVFVKEILNEIENFANEETSKESKEYFKEVIKHIDNQ